MESLRKSIVALSVVAVVLFPVLTLGQLPDYPPEFSPLRTSRPARPQQSLVPPTKFIKHKDPIPNRYIVVLNDDVVASSSPLEARRAAVAAVAESHAQEYRGKVDYIYETALKGYAIELPDEDAAIALSKNPQVQWVEEDAQVEWSQRQIQPNFLQFNPPWGLDAIDGSIPVPTPDANGRTSGVYIYNATGAFVTVYILDSGINIQHTEFFNGFNSRASQAADCFTFVNCQSGQMTPFFNQQQCVHPMPNSANNDCHGHGTHVAGTAGGTNVGVAKEVRIKSVKIGSTRGAIISATINGVNWVTSDHQASPASTAVVNMSFGLPIGTVETAVSNSIANGVTYVAAAGNSNAFAGNDAPQNLVAVLSVGAVDWTLVGGLFQTGVRTWIFLRPALRFYLLGQGIFCCKPAVHGMAPTTPFVGYRARPWPLPMSQEQ